MRLALFFANLDGFGDHQVVRTLVEMLFHAEDLSYRRRTADPSNFHEADQLILVVGADKNASVQIGRQWTLYRLQVFPVVPEVFSLPYRNLIVDSRNALEKLIVEFYDLCHQAGFLCPIHTLPNAVFCTLIPPV